MSERLLTIQEVSDRTRLPVATLRFMRHQNKGPQSGKLGRRVVYREADVDVWIDEQMAADDHRRARGQGAA